LQDATGDSPRIVFFNPDARMILAVTGQGAMAAGQELEMIDFDDSTSTFHFHEVTFPADPQVGSVTFYPSDPPKCLACHRSTPSPNWEAYPLWPGVYGSMPTAVLQGAKKEIAFYQSFLEHSAHADRYRYLADDVTKLSLDDLHDRNLAMGQAISERNEQRILRLVKSLPEFENFSYALAGIQKSCGNLADFFPPQRSPPYKPADSDSFVAEINRQVLGHYKEMASEAVQLDGGDDSFEQSETTWEFAFAIERSARAAYVLKTYMNFDLAPFTLSLDGPVFYSHATFVQMLTDLLPKTLLSLGCDELALESRGALVRQ
jgi:hypothetical protein